MLQDFVFPGYSYFPIPIQETEKTGHAIYSPLALCHDSNNSRILQFPNKFVILALDLANQHKTGHLYENNFKFGEYYLSKKPNDFESKMTFKMSFDTVKFGVPCSPMDFEKYKNAFIPYQQFASLTLNCEIDFVTERFKLVTGSEILNLPSNYSGVVFTYSDSGHVVFEMSIPKQLYGHNSLMYWQLDTFFHRFRNYLINHTGLNIEPWENWLLKRVDVCYNYHLDSYQDVRSTLDYLAELRFRGKPPRRDSYGKNIAYWAFQTRTIKFYSKYEEMLIHKKSFDPDTYDIVLENSRNILRFEEEWRSKYLLSKLNLKRVNEITVKKFIDFVVKDYNRHIHVKSLLGECSMIDKKFSLISILDSVSKLKKSDMYRLFVLSIVDNGLDFVKESMAKSSYYQKVKVLKSIGVDVSVINERFHQDNVNVQSEIKQDFTKSPLSNICDDEAAYKQSFINPNPAPVSLRDFLSSKELRFDTLDGLNASLPPEYQIKLFTVPLES